jgi:hypothetical protein
MTKLRWYVTSNKPTKEEINAYRTAHDCVMMEAKRILTDLRAPRLQYLTSGGGLHEPRWERWVDVPTEYGPNE